MLSRIFSADLTTILRFNAASCLLFGAFFSVSPEAVAQFLSGTEPAPSGFIRVVGIVLMGNGLHLSWAAHQTTKAHWLMRYFALGDLIWVMTSVALVAAGIWVTRPLGIIATLLVAVMVAFFGLCQWRAPTHD